MLKIYLARHGQDEDNAAGILNGRRDMPLTVLGMSQAEALAAEIKSLGLSFDAIYASPLQRTQQTAKAVAEGIGQAEITICEDLIERDFGIMTGEPIVSIPEKCAPDILQAEKITYFLNPDGAETFPELLERAEKLLKEVHERHEDGNILLVTHGDCGKMIYAAYYNQDWKKTLQQFHFGNSELILLSPDSSAEEAHVVLIEQHNA